MTPRDATTLRNEGGFTLVELLVSLSLLVVMLALINGALNFGRRAWEVSDRVEQTDRVAAFRNLLTQRLAEALPLVAWDDAGVLLPTFNGASEELTFLAAMPSRDGMPAGLFAVSLKLLPEAGRRGRPLALEFGPIAGLGTPPAAGGASIILDEVTQLAIRYYGAAERAEAKWVDEWRGQTALPRLVAVDVQFASGDTRAWPLMTTELKLGSRERTGR